MNPYADPQALRQIREVLGSQSKSASLKLGVAEMTGVRAALAAMMSQLDVAEMTGVRAALAAMMPRLDVAEMTGVRATLAAGTSQLAIAATSELRQALEAAMPRIDYSALAPTLSAIRDHLAAAALSPVMRSGTDPLFDLHEVSGLRAIVDSIAATIDLDQVSGLANSTERLLHERSIENFEDQIDPALLQWAASVEAVEQDTTTSSSSSSEETGELTAVQRNLLAVAKLFLVTAAHLQAGATRLRSGMATVNKAVDSINEQAERYEKLAYTLLKLYGAFLVLTEVVPQYLP